MNKERQENKLRENICKLKNCNFYLQNNFTASTDLKRKIIILKYNLSTCVSKFIYRIRISVYLKTIFHLTGDFSSLEDNYTHTHTHTHTHIYIYIVYMGFPGGTSGKEFTHQCRRHKRHRFDPWVGKMRWRRAWQPAPVFLPGESHGQRSLVVYSP